MKLPMATSPQPYGPKVVPLVLKRTRELIKSHQLAGHPTNLQGQIFGLAFLEM